MNADEKGKKHNPVNTWFIIRLAVLGMVSAVLGFALSHGTFYLIKGKPINQFVAEELVYSDRQHTLLFVVVCDVIPDVITIAGVVLAWKWLRARESAKENEERGRKPSAVSSPKPKE